MLLAPYAAVVERQNSGGDCPADDPNTAAAARTSSGHLIRVSLRPAPPPALSRVCVHFPELSPVVGEAYSTVIAAHGGSMLIYVRLVECSRKYWVLVADYFVYSYSPGAAADADAARRPPPSLCLLPPYYCASNRGAIGILRRGEVDELVVAELRNAPGTVAELLLFRAGEWRVKWPRICCTSHREEDDILVAAFEARAVVPLSGRLLCWIDSTNGVLFSDVFEESPTLRFVPYPEEIVFSVYPRRLRESSYVCVTARGEVKLVSDVSPRSSDSDSEQHASSAVTTWTLKTDGIMAAWVVEPVVESTDLWALDVDYCGIARVQLVFPVAGMVVGGDPVVADESAAAPTDEEEEEHTAGKGQKRQAELSTPRRSERATKRNVRVTGHDWVN